jgi:hypothetical protein
MDPNFFRIDWDILGQVLVTIIVMSFFVERALSPVVESRAFIERFPASGIKEGMSLVLSVVAVIAFQFDALAIMFHSSTTTWIGLFITAAVISGGSKASIKLFHDVLDVKSNAVREQEAPKTVMKAKTEETITVTQPPARPSQ